MARKEGSVHGHGMAPASGDGPRAEEIQSALNHTVRSTLVPLYLGVAALFAFFAVTDGLTMPPAEARYVATFDATVALLLAGVGLGMRRWPVPDRWANAAIGAVAFLVIAFGAAVMTVRPYPIESIVFIMLVLGASVVLLSYRWLLAVTAVSLAVWSWFALTAPSSDEWVQYGQSLVTSGVLAAIVLHVRRKALSKAENLRALEGQARRRAEDAVASAEEHRGRLEEAQRQAHIGSWVWDIPKNSVTWSDELFRLFGVEPGSIALDYQGYISRVHPDDRAKVERFVQQAFAFHGPFEFEHRASWPNGEVHWIYGRGSVVVDAGGKAIRMVGTAQDIDARKRTEQDERVAQERRHEIERLRAMDAFKSQFINEAAHELNTPLTPIRIQLALLRTRLGPRPSKDQVESLQMIQRNLERFSALVGDVLDSARLQAKKLGIRREPLDLVPLLAEAVASFRPAAERSGTTLEARLPERLEIEGDPVRVTQVIFNLISNALKYTPPGGRVEVSAGAGRDLATVSVRDTGIGIQASDFEKLFKPFSQVHDPAETKVPGTGLGLYVSRGIVDLHKGRIWAESAGRGRGSTFSFSIPLRARDSRAPRPAREIVTQLDAPVPMTSS